jgi:hypothetical protein
MDSQISGIVAEIFLQNLETQTLKHLMEQKVIIYYTQYVNDILVIHNRNKSIPITIFETFNRQHRSLTFTVTQDTNSQIVHLDLNISDTMTNIKADNYWKPTMADTTINIQSCHPGEKNRAIFKSLLHRQHTPA